MDIFSMQCFLSAAEHLNISKAALQMHITQPAMSMQIKKLEQEIGTSLFERDSRKMRLTPAGQVVQSSFQSIVGTYQTMQWQVKSLEEHRPILRIGYHGPSNWAGILELFQRFIEENPQTRIRIQMGEYAELARLVEEGQLDVAFLESSEYKDYDLIQWEFLFDDYSCFAMSCDHPLADREIITTEDLKDQKVYFNLYKSASMQGIYRKLIQSGIAPENLYCVEDTYTSIVVAAAAGGLAALPITFKESDNDKIVYIDHDSSVVHMRFGLVWRKDNETEALQRFMACCKNFEWPNGNKH